MTDAGASAVVASTSAAVLHSLGLDPYILAIAVVGAVLLQAWSDSTASRWRAMVQVLCSGLVGALLAATTGVVAAAEMALAAFCGFGAFDLFTALAKEGSSLIGTVARRWGSKP